MDNITRQLISILRRIAQEFEDAAQEIEIDSIPKGAHYIYGTASGDTVRLECNGITAECPVLSGRYGCDDNALSMPAAYGNVPGARDGDTINVYLDGLLMASLPFQEKGLTQINL